MANRFCSGHVDRFRQREGCFAGETSVESFTREAACLSLLLSLRPFRCPLSLNLGHVSQHDHDVEASTTITQPNVYLSFRFDFE